MPIFRVTFLYESRADEIRREELNELFHSINDVFVIM